MSDATRARNEMLKREFERSLDAAEARDYLEQPVSQTERDGVLALVRWFRRRYPTPAARLEYVRRAYARWSRMNRSRG